MSTGVWGTLVMGHIGDGAHWQWGTWAMDYISNGGIGAMGYKGMWQKGMLHMGNGAHG